MAYIYVITNNINGKQYVGKTHYSIEKRFQEHLHDSKRKRCEKRPLYSAINKYGSENFSIELLEECSVDEVADREIYWIDKLNTYHYGYNATHGGDGKKLYDYKELADKYLELETVKAVMEYFHCDAETVRSACKEYNISIIPGSEHAKQHRKPIWMLDKQTGKKIQKFESIMAAAHHLGSSAYHSHIAAAAKGSRKSAYGYKWEYVDK